MDGVSDVKRGNIHFKLGRDSFGQNLYTQRTQGLKYPPAFCNSFGSTRAANGNCKFYRCFIVQNIEIGMQNPIGYRVKLHIF